MENPLKDNHRKFISLSFHSVIICLLPIMYQTLYKTILQKVEQKDSQPTFLGHSSCHPISVSFSTSISLKCCARQNRQICNTDSSFRSFVSFSLLQISAPLSLLASCSMFSKLLADKEIDDNRWLNYETFFQCCANLVVDQVTLADSRSTLRTSHLQCYQ